MSTEFCPNQDKQNWLDPIMRRLHERQAGAGRHKCAYCAYIAGYIRGLKDAERREGDDFSKKR